jgi:protein TonB
LKDWTLISHEVRHAAKTLQPLETPERPVTTGTVQRTLVPLDVAPSAAAEIWKGSGGLEVVRLILRSLFASDEAAKGPALVLTKAADRAESEQSVGLRTLIPLAHPVGSGQEGRAELSFAPASDDAFLEAMLDQPTTRWHANRLKMPVSIALHAGALALLIVVPLFFAESVDLKELGGKYGLIGVAPPPPPAAPPPAPVVVRAPHTKVVPMQARLTMPTVVPKTISTAPEEPPPDVPVTGDPNGVVGGIPGGQGMGVLGGILGGVSTNAAAVPPPPGPSPPAGKRVYMVGGNIHPPRQVVATKPEYPMIARSAKIQGIVMLKAEIDEEGNVVALQAVSGHPLLIPAALKCVSQWKYEPTLLNGTPISVRLIVEVTFNLGK